MSVSEFNEGVIDVENELVKYKKNGIIFVFSSPLIIFELRYESTDCQYK